MRPLDWVVGMTLDLCIKWFRWRTGENIQLVSIELIPIQKREDTPWPGKTSETLH